MEIEKLVDIVQEHGKEWAKDGQAVLLVLQHDEGNVSTTMFGSSMADVLRMCSSVMKSSIEYAVEQGYTEKEFTDGIKELLECSHTAEPGVVS